MHIAQYKEEYRKNVIKLLSQGKGPVYSKTKHKIWDWEYNQIPFVSDLSKGIAIIEESKTVGYYGFMPAMLRYQGNTIEGHWNINAILDPICRGKGYGKIMYGVGKTISKVALGFGITDIAAHIMRKQGYKVNHEIEQYFYSSKYNNFRSIIKRIFQYFIIVINIVYRPKRCDLKIRIDDASNAPKQIDSLWKKIEFGYSKIVIRNYSYIKWKYGDCPLARYQIIIIERGNELVGLGVFRKNKDISTLVDYVGPSKDPQIKYLIVKTFKMICSRSRLLSCICTDEEIKKSLEILGFLKYKYRPRFYIYSNIEGDHAPESNWFIMAGDSDGDLHNVMIFD